MGHEVGNFVVLRIERTRFNDILQHYAVWNDTYTAHSTIPDSGIVEYGTRAALSKGESHLYLLVFKMY